MKRAPWLRFNLIASVATLGVALLLWGSCGRGGGGDDDEAGDEDGGGGTVEVEIRDVSGHFFYGSTSRPAGGSELWVLNHSSATASFYALADNGGFKIPLSYFVEDEVYSFHLVRDSQLIGDVDLSPSNSEVQTAFTYRGGYGFDMGDVVVPLDRHGSIDLTAGGLQGKTGGGFSLVTDVEADFSTFPVPAFLSAASVGSHLVISDASVLLNSFYNRIDHPLDYGKDLNAWSRIGVLVVSKEAGAVERAFAEEGGRWLAAARLASGIESPPNASPLWAVTDRDLVQVTDKVWRASSYVGALPEPQAIVTIRIAPKVGAQATVPRALRTILTMPPTVISANASGSAMATVAYDSPTANNGLTRPFCQTGEVSLEVAPPLDATGQPVPATTLDRIDVEFDFYKKVGGQAPRLAQVAANFEAPYNANYEDEAGDIKRTWDAGLTRLRFEIGATAGAADTQEIHIPSGLFPRKVGSSTVGKVRLRIYYRSETDATEGGTVVWLNKGC